MILKRLYSSHASKLITYFEQSIANVNCLHSDIFKRQESIQRQMHNMYLDMADLDRQMDEIKNHMIRMHDRMNALERNIEED